MMTKIYWGLHMAENSMFGSLLRDIRIAPPGLVLIGISVVLIYLAAMRPSQADVITVAMLTLAFVLAIGGIILFFRAGISAASLETSQLGGSSDVEEAVRQLGKNYDILRRQSTQGFLLAGTFMALGILVILTGSLGEMFGFTKSTSNLTTVAGVVVEVVSGLGLYLFKETFKQLNATSDKLHDMWKVLAAFKKIDALPEDRRADVAISVIQKFINLPTATA
ncbi:MAG: hypothetical protein Q8L22_11805 [Reyranella sp.]|nr:hypothetical protein [Reyranella sp.]